MRVEIFKTQLFFSDYDQGRPHLVDTILHLGRWWLVGEWLLQPGAGDKMPTVLVLLDGLAHEEMSHHHPFRFLLTNAIPKSVLDGQEQGEYEVLNLLRASH